MFIWCGGERGSFVSFVFKISEAVTLALHTMVLLEYHSNSKLSTKEIAEIYEVSENHLSKVLQRLTKVGLVKSSRGPKGGVVLARQGGKITLLEIYEAFEGPIQVEQCLLDSYVCKKRSCLFGNLLVDLNKQVKQYLQEKTIAHVKNMCEGLPQSIKLKKK